jgi:hypothetical protein
MLGGLQEEFMGMLSMLPVVVVVGGVGLLCIFNF